MNTVRSTCHDDVNTRRPVGNERGRDTAPYSAISPGKKLNTEQRSGRTKILGKKGGDTCTKDKMRD